MKRDFKDFDKKIDLILKDITDLDKEALKHRIGQELDTYESKPELYEAFRVTRDRIRTIERKALKKLGKNVPTKMEKGKRCSLCPEYESDVDVMIYIGHKHNVCSKCILLIKDVIDEVDK